MLWENLNIELHELSVIENIDKITMLVCKQNKLTDLYKILDYKSNNENFLSLEYSNSAVNQKLLLICKKYLENPPTVLIPVQTQANEQDLNQIIPNYNLESLKEIEELEVREYNACRYSKLLTLNEIVQYYKRHGNFLKIKNCGKKSNEKLISISNKYKDFQISEIEITGSKEHVINNGSIEIPLSILAKEEELSVRTQNICEDNELITIQLILKYYYEHNNFLELRNCGRKSNEELIAICKKYENLNFSYSHVEELTNPLINKIEDLTTKQKAVLNNIIYSKFNQLSVRSRNALIVLLENSITVRAIKEEFFAIEDYDFKKIKNIGELTAIEISSFINDIKKHIDLVSIFEDNEIRREYFNSYLLKNYQVSYDTINKIGKNYDFNLGFPIFKTIFYLIDDRYLLDEKERGVFFGLLNILYRTTAPLIKDYKINLQLTNERIRQIRSKTLKKIPNIIRGLFNIEFSFDNLNTYQLLPTDEFIYLSVEDVLKINESENVNFNSYFIVYIFSILLKETHFLLGDIENVFLNKLTSTQHNWNNFYLIRKDLSWIFNFEKFIQDIYARVSSKNEEDYKFHFQSYLLNFQNDNCVSRLDRISTICETILFSEFELTIDLEENIIFKRNTVKQVYEYAYEALEKLGTPSRVDEIHNKVSELYPDYKTDEDKIRASMKRKTGFVSFGRTSVYGLKVWEEEKDIRGGTIRDIAEEYLMEQTTPKHIKEITEFVNKYRDTNAKNIYANLSMEENNRFVFFKGLMVGLKCKKYDESILVNIDNVQFERKNWEERFSQLKAFAQTNNRLPFSSGVDLEQQLYRFLQVQLNKTKKRLIESSKSEQIKELVNRFNCKKDIKIISQ